MTVRSRSREPSLQPARITVRPPACSALIWATAASNTLAFSSARSGAKDRPGRPPQSIASSGASKGVARRTGRAARAVPHSASVM